MSIEGRDGAALFAHVNNITIGKGRVLWAKATKDTAGAYHAQGWVLPGGRRTTSEVAARTAALLIDELTGAAS